VQNREEKRRENLVKSVKRRKTKQKHRAKPINSIPSARPSVQHRKTYVQQSRAEHTHAIMQMMIETLASSFLAFSRLMVRLSTPSLPTAPLTLYKPFDKRTAGCCQLLHFFLLIGRQFSSFSSFSFLALCTLHYTLTTSSVGFW